MKNKIKLIFCFMTILFVVGCASSVVIYVSKNKDLIIEKTINYLNDIFHFEDTLEDVEYASDKEYISFDVDDSTIVDYISNPENYSSNAELISFKNKMLNYYKSNDDFYDDVEKCTIVLQSKLVNEKNKSMYIRSDISFESDDIVSIVVKSNDNTILASYDGLSIKSMDVKFFECSTLTVGDSKMYLMINNKYIDGSAVSSDSEINSYNNSFVTDLFTIKKVKNETITDERTLTLNSSNVRKLYNGTNILDTEVWGSTPFKDLFIKNSSNENIGDLLVFENVYSNPSTLEKLNFYIVISVDDDLPLNICGIYLLNSNGYFDAYSYVENHQNDNLQELILTENQPIEFTNYLLSSSNSYVLKNASDNYYCDWSNHDNSITYSKFLNSAININETDLPGDLFNALFTINKK